ncbi:hypothetical protein DN752_02095 [Echinicola strongylocentroti]|uniref:Uncharacterized protein n=1 Tax=Echinicola strongylocentroti TaxID=1795355 RepID=A0A2Z4IF00_9BACT|nr:hypothetical protein DN752_02095 [Echinicola strongylocentroti]
MKKGTPTSQKSSREAFPNRFKRRIAIGCRYVVIGLAKAANRKNALSEVVDKPIILKGVCTSEGN